MSAAVAALPVRRRRRGARRTTFRAVQYALLVIVVLGASAPLIWIFLTAFKPDTEIVSYPPTLLPAQPTLDNFRTLMQISPFGSYLRNSATVALVSTAVTVVVSTLAAYTFARFRFWFLRGLSELALFAYMIPPILLLVPIARMMFGVGLGNNLTALVVLYTATQLPFALWILRSYFHGIAADLEEAAMVDGCTRFGAFRRVVIPQAVPGMIATAVFTFNAAWSEYLFAATLMTSRDSMTLSPGVALLIHQTGVYSWGVLMAAAVIVVAPALVFFLLAQRRLVGGLADGAVRG